MRPVPAQRIDAAIHGGVVAHAVATVWLWLVRRRTRGRLARVVDDPHVLNDIGLTPDEARRESAKRFWER
jgi:uncharacterized protein YjiS (DUF1127 family)